MNPLVRIAEGAEVHQRRLEVCPESVHEELKADPVAWAELRAAGMQPDGAGGHLELRNCACGSTLGRRVVRPGGVA